MLNSATVADVGMSGKRCHAEVPGGHTGNFAWSSLHPPFLAHFSVLHCAQFCVDYKTKMLPRVATLKKLTILLIS